jgi:hypothetical protein
MLLSMTRGIAWRAFMAAMTVVVLASSLSACSPSTSSPNYYPTTCPTAADARPTLGDVVLESAGKRTGAYVCVYVRKGVDVDLIFAPGGATSIAQFRSQERSYQKLTYYRTTNLSGIGTAAYEFGGFDSQVNVIAWVDPYQVDLSERGTSLGNVEAFLRVAISQAKGVSG